MSLLILCVTIFSCQSETEKKISGVWCINKIYYNNNNIKFNFYSNILSFKDDHTCRFPSTINGEDISGKWGVKKINDSIYVQIHSNKQEFEGSFILEFISNNPLTITLQSKNTIMNCSKMGIGNDQ